MNRVLGKWITSLFTISVISVVIYVLSLIFGVSSLAFGWSYNFLLMGLYWVLIQQIQPNLNWKYFELEWFDKYGLTYRYLGVHLYRKLLVIVGWEKVTRKNNNDVKNDLAALKNCEYNTRISEFGHTLIAVLVLVTAAMLYLLSSFSDVKWLLLTNVLLNVYPILVQRFNRPRYQRIIQTKQRIGNSFPAGKAIASL